MLKHMMAGLACSTLLSSAVWASVPLPEPRPGSALSYASTTPAPIPGLPVQRSPAASAPLHTAAIGGLAGSARNIRQDAPVVRSALAALRNGRLSEGLAFQQQARDPATRTLIEWLAIRHASRQIGSDRIIAFMSRNPHWPVSTLINRRAEEALYLEKAAPQTVNAFFGNRRATTPMGQLAQARSAHRAQAAALVKDAWMRGEFSESVEIQILKEFGGLITADDHVRRTEYMLLNGKNTNALRAAKRAPAAYQSVVKARIAVANKAPNAKAALNGMSSSARRYTGYHFAHLDYLLRNDQIREAAAVLHKVPRDAAALVDPDAWWQKRRWLARDLLDMNDARTAYQVASEHVGGSDTTRADAHFHAGWIALRFLNDPRTAMRHFDAIAQIGSSPLTRSRAHYWQGRAAEAAGDRGGAGRFFSMAANHTTTYYGQLARGKLGMKDLPLKTPPAASNAVRSAFASNPGVRGIELLYAINEPEQAIALYSDLASSSNDPAFLGLLANLAHQNKDTRGELLVGRTAIRDGHPLDVAAWPLSGIPPYRAVGPAIEKAVVYSIARQESAFNHRAVSHADARGLLQMLPATARRTASNYGMAFNAALLTQDASYNAALGAAHLGELSAEYRGSYIMTFAAYNAGHSRVMTWVQRYGDPRDPRVDPVDWVERIPFQETRNYVQRVLENVQVYRARMAGNISPLHIEQDMVRGR